MTDESPPMENELVALQIGKAILNAQMMADRIVSEARERAQTIAATDGAPAPVPPSLEGRSRVGLIPREEAVVMLRELDSAEQELQDCQAELVAFLDRCLQNLGSPAREPVGVDYEPREPDPASPAETTSGFEDSFLEPTTTNPHSNLGESSDQVRDELETIEPEVATIEPEISQWPVVGVPPETAQPPSQADDSFWRRDFVTQPWDSAELESLGRPGVQPPQTPTSDEGEDGISAHPDGESPGMAPIFAHTDALLTPQSRADVTASVGDHFRQASQETRERENWAPPSGPPVVVPTAALPAPPLTVTDTGNPNVSEDRGAQVGAFRRLASLPNMVALAGTLVALLVLLILVQTL